MSKKVSLGTFIATSVVLMMLAAVVTFQITVVSVDKKYADEIGELSERMETYDKLAAVDAYYREYYVGELNEEELTDGILYGYIYGTGDKYAYYLNKEDYAAAKQDNSGEMVGIGIHVIYSNSLIEIISVMPDSPALEAGILPGDIITHVGGEAVSELGYYAAIDKMLGDAGTNAEFTIVRDGASIDYSVVRKKIDAVSVESRVLASDPTIGVVRILQFDLGTANQFKDACENLRAGGVTRFIFDVRNNPGGDLTAICKVLDYLLPEGPIIRIVDKAGNEEIEYSDAAYLDAPMCVLVNGNTASAGELFAAALQDYDAAELVGTTTYGKGTMQSVIPLGDGSGFGMSISMYYPPFSECYEGVGVIPDHPCELSEEAAKVNIYKLTDSMDTQLQKAVEVLTAPAAE